MMKFVQANTRVLSMILIVFFAIVNILGLFHGFPLVDIFADESYFANGPLYSFQHLTPFPHRVPYGTVTFYFASVIQVGVLGVLLVLHGFSIEAVIQGIMAHPYLAYIAPRLLNGVLFMSMLLTAIRMMQAGTSAARPYARSIILICFASLPLLAFTHSGKMWVTCVFFIFLAAVHFPLSALRSVIFASLAFANFQLMGVFWLQTIALACWKHTREHKPVRLLVLVAILIPLAVTALNYVNFFDQIRVIFGSYIFPEVARQTNYAGSTAAVSSIGSIFLLYISTAGSYIVKIIATSLPMVALLLTAIFTRACIRTVPLFIYGVSGFILYFFVISLMFYSAEHLTYLRYVLPFHVLLIIIFLSLEFHRSRFASVCIGAIAAFSVYFAVVSTISFMLPTTYNHAYQMLLAEYGEGDLIFLHVSQIGMPVHRASAEFLRQYAPDRCSNQCMYALEHADNSDFRAIVIPYSEEANTAAQRILHDGGIDRIIDVTIDAADTEYASAEYGMGSYFIREAWLPRSLGQAIVIRQRQN